MNDDMSENRMPMLDEVRMNIGLLKESDIRDVIGELIALYLKAKEMRDAVTEVMNEVKKGVQGYADTTGETELFTEAGGYKLREPAVSVRYDAKGLDGFMLDNPALAKVLGQYRITKTGKPVLAISKPKQVT